MDKAFKGGSVLWISVSAICLFCAVTLLFFMFQEKNRRIETEERLVSVEKAKRTVEIKLDHAQIETTQLKEQARLLARQAEEDKRRVQAALAQLEGKDLNIKELETSLANEKRQRTDLANRLAQLRETCDRLEDRLEEARRGYADSSGRAGVELKRIVVKPKKQLEGKVLVVNREFHFVVIDLGRQDKVGLGDEFLVYQQAKEIGKVQVEKIYDTMSTAVILPGSQEAAILEDTVVKSF